MALYERILVPVDGSPTSTRGLDEALALAGAFGARLRLVHVVDAPPFAFAPDAFGGSAAGDMLTLLREAGQKVLDDAARRAGERGIAVETVLHDDLTGRVCDFVAADARAWPAQLIVIGTHGRRGASRLVLGSDAEQILRVSPVPVLLVRDDAAA